LDKNSLLAEIKEMAYHNLRCYSEDNNIENAKLEYQKEWHREKAKIEIIEDLINEQKESNFQLYTTVYYIKNNLEKRELTELAYLEDREKGVSCYLTLVDNAEKFDERKMEYELTFSVHKKSNFDSEYENVLIGKLDLNAFNNRKTLQEEMQRRLDEFSKYIEIDKKTCRCFKEFYEDEEENQIE